MSKLMDIHCRLYPYPNWWYKKRNIAACYTGLKDIKRLEGMASKKNNLIIAIGSSIKWDKYQVDKEDVEDLIIQLTGKKYMHRWNQKTLWKKKNFKQFWY